MMEHMVAEDHEHNDLPGMMHSHDPIEVDPDLPVPAISIEVTEDAMAGVNVSISTENFTWAPEKASNTGPNPNEGHAHLYANGVKVGRVYGSHYHIGTEYLQRGDNEINVTLNANQHSDWTLDGEKIEDTVIISL
jgi:uncharacterized membrane protein YvbJ